MNIHFICTDSQGISRSEITKNFSKDITISVNKSRKNILLLEKAMVDSATKSEAPDLIIIKGALDNNAELSFRKMFAGIIYRAEKKIQEKPWIQVKKQLKKQAVTNIFRKKKDSEKISRDVPYDKKKTHIFTIEHKDTVSYTFPFMNTQVLVLPENFPLEEISPLTEKAINIIQINQEKYPQGYTTTDKTYRILTVKEKYIPAKTDSQQEKSRKIVRLSACFIFIIAGILFLNKTVFMPISNNNSIVEVQSLIYENETDPKTGEKVIKTANWDKLKKINKEIIGWIKIKNTRIDYPVVQRKTDNSKSQFYLYHNYKGESSSYGSIFVDYRSKKGLKSKNVVIHGHNMNDGSMFENLMKYGKTEGNLAFYKKAPTIQISTKDGGTETYKIFSIFKSNVNPRQGEYFDFYCSQFRNDSQFMNYVYNLKIRSLIDTGVTVNEDDQLLTLVTCSYEFYNFRTVVVARKCREGENENIDTSVAKLQKNPLWPQIYYTYKGKNRPKVSTFKKQYNKEKITWYDGDGNLDGKEFLPTSTEIPTEPTTAATETTTANTTEKIKPVATYFKVWIYERDELIKMVQVKSGKKVKLPKVRQSFVEDGYKYTFLRWEYKGSSTNLRINQNTVITAVYWKAKINQETTTSTKHTNATSPTTKPTEKPTQPSTATETTVPSENQQEDEE